MTTCFVTGCGGFIGSHLAEWLLAQNCRLTGTVRRSTPHLAHLAGRCDVHTCEITDGPRLTSLIRAAQPEFVFHVAAQTSVQRSWEDPRGVFTANTLGTVAVLEAVRESCPTAVVQVLGSALEYGASAPEELPIREARPPRPTNPYALAKLAAVELGRLYARRYGMQVHAVRPFQFVGPRKYPDACSEFARGIVAVERGRTAEIRVGNLDVVRDFLDVRDGVRAMWVIARLRQVGEIFNICSGIGRPLREILHALMGIARCAAPIREAAGRLRPLDVPVIVGDNSKLRVVGWVPEIPIEQTLTDILDYWRAATD